MDLSNLTNTSGARERRKRVGRGCGSGMGKTSTRGHKGQTAAADNGFPVPAAVALCFFQQFIYQTFSNFLLYSP